MNLQTLPGFFRGCALFTAGFIALIAAGCGGQNGPGAGTPATNSEPPAVSGSPLTSATPAPGSPSPPLIDSDTGETITPYPVPKWDDASRASLLSAAVKTMTAFARPDLPEKQWWAALEPLLTAEGAQFYSFVDPANIPARKVTGPPVIVNEESAYVTDVDIPTDAGVYRLVITRSHGAAPWLVSRIAPKESE